MSFFTRRIFLMTVDPVHIGTGGMRLGRVDQSIVREPGTRLPKIPGTSLSGAARSYAAHRYRKPSCAGQGGHCGKPTCPICYTFGSVTGERSFAGVVSIADARVLLFPVYSMAGPVWVSAREILEEAGFAINENNTFLTTLEWNKPLNLGWLMIEQPGKVEINPPPDLATRKEWGTVKNRIVLVPPKLFSQIVNSNLEVRTSVSINPETGAAEEKALFTYEAIPRATFLWMDVVVDDYRGAFPVTEKECKVEEKEEDGKKLKVYKDNEGNPFPRKWENPADVVAAGLEWAEHLGIGGMGTRGFGRIRKIAEVKL